MLGDCPCHRVIGENCCKLLEECPPTGALQKEPPALFQDYGCDTISKVVASRSRSPAWEVQRKSTANAPPTPPEQTQQSRRMKSLTRQAPAASSSA